jgi:chaperonin GroES
MPLFALLAFGHGENAELDLAPPAASERLRLILDKALNAADDFTNAGLTVSVAPSGVMLAFPDSRTDRAVMVVEAVKAQLEAAISRKQPTVPIAGVLTYGLMRQVEVFGHTSNFEGRPAIAAARILARLPTGVFAVEESAWGFDTLARDLREQVRVIKGKHAGEQFRIRLHRALAFPSAAEAAAVRSRKVRPLSDRILVEREEAQFSTGGIIIPDTAKEKPQRGKVVAVGGGKITAVGSRIALDVKPGDRILFGKYSGYEVTIESDEYLILREKDVLAILE